MRTLLYAFLIFWSSAILSEPGTIGRFHDNKITYFTPKKTYEVAIDKLSAKDKKTVENHLNSVDLIRDYRIPYRQRQRFDLEVNEHFTVTEEDQDGIRPDCNEQPLSPEEIFELANSAPKGGMVEFLQSLPEGSMQIMTMMKETQSRQHHGVSPENPRILRSNADGSMTISFICDPSSHDYGKVEMMYFDRDEDRFKMATLDFTNDQDKEVEPFDRYRFSHLENTPDSYKDHNRINHNPRSCLKCHSNDPDALDPDPRALWDDYNQWRGAFGRNDDIINDYSIKLRNEIINLRKKMEGNPCFETLPMPKLNPSTEKGEWGEDIYDDSWIYPYSNEQTRNYDRRHNLRFTDNLARFGARRLVRKFFEAPGFQRVRYETAMATFNCPQIPNYDEVFKKINPNYDPIAPRATEEHRRKIRREQGVFSPEIQRGPNRDFRELFELGKAYGFQNSDWTLFYNEDDRNSYQAPSSLDTRSDGFGDLVQGDLLRRLQQESPSLNGLVQNIFDIEELFGERNSCIEEETTPIQTHETRDIAGISALCAELDKLRKQAPQPLDPLSSPNDNEALNASIERCLDEKFGEVNTNFEQSFVRRLSKESLDLYEYDVGRSVAGTCVQCHSKDNEVLPNSVAFFDSEEATKEEMRKGPEFMATVRAYINSGRMPKGIPLEQEQRDAFLYYMENLYVDALTSP